MRWQRNDKIDQITAKFHRWVYRRFYRLCVLQKSDDFSVYLIYAETPRRRDSVNATSNYSDAAGVCFIQTTVRNPMCHVLSFLF